MEEYKNDSYGVVDIFKFIFSIVVISIHTKALSNVNNRTIESIYGLLCDMAVPFFFLSSGFFIGKKIEKNLKHDNGVAVFDEKIKKTIKSYCFWSLIYLPLAIYEYITKKIPFFKSFLLYLKGFFIKGENYNSWILWYLLSTIYSLIVIRFLFKRKISFKKITIICMTISVLGVCFSFLLNQDISNIAILNSIKDIIIRLFTDFRIVSGLFYLAMGIYLSRIQINKYISTVTFFISIVLYFVVGPLFKDIVTMVVSSSFLALVSLIRTNNLKGFVFLRKLSISNYYLHLLVYSFYVIVLHGDDIGITAFAFTLITTLVLGLIFNLQNKKVISIS